MQSQIVCPIFQVSNKTREGIELFKNFLNNLQFSNKEDTLEKQTYGGEFHISKTFKKTNETLILEGIVHKGKFQQHQKALLGPNAEGRFCVIEIQSLHSNRVPV
jgi:GTPase